MTNINCLVLNVNVFKKTFFWSAKRIFCYFHLVSVKQAIKSVNIVLFCFEQNNLSCFERQFTPKNYLLLWKTNILLFPSSFSATSSREGFFNLCCKILVQMKVFRWRDQVLKRNKGDENMFFMTNINCLVLNDYLSKYAHLCQ